ncbi:TusE/DsrC/DsvC family sulfur relay protein [Litorivivens sp.]|uniref:TusE/DsrC/DsvC family sulfur relay protein n=1 Tax=Litorivivens sp. TaxID=2020868 RepID=UPI00356567E1
MPLATDDEGYLLNLADWNRDVATQLAAAESIILTPEHWELIALIQAFYREFDHSPAMRPLVKYAQQELGPNKGNSLHFLKLFPGSPAKLLSKIAGLPRPENCL